MKKVILGLAVLFCAVLVISCSKSSPKDVVNQYVEAMQAKDYEKAADCFYYGKEENTEEARAQLIALLEKGGKSIEEKGGIKSFEVLSDEENEDKGIVKGKIVYGNGEVDEDATLTTVKVDGKWFIDLESK